MKFALAYTFLFLYIVAALVFWGYSLNKQSKMIYQYDKEILSMNNVSPEEKIIELQKIEDKKNRRTKQYWAEGATFLIIILLSATVVYTSFYKQLRVTRLQQNFMMSVTHELKTPIAGVLLNLQTIKKHELPREKELKLIENSIIETNRLNELCNNILVASQLDIKLVNKGKEQCEIKLLVSNVVQEFKYRYPQLQIIYNTVNENVYIHGEATLWKLVVSNLVENARKYSDTTKPVRVQLNKNKQHKYELLVIDEGKGIPDDEKHKIFKKFYRIGNENTRSTKGTGLGLFIVKKVVKLYNYDIAVKNNSPNGSIFAIQFYPSKWYKT